MEVTRVRVEGLRLARERRDDARVSVPDAGHIVIGIEEPSPLLVVEPDTLAPDDVQRFVIGQTQRLAEGPAPAPREGVSRFRVRGDGVAPGHPADSPQRFRQ